MTTLSRYERGLAADIYLFMTGALCGVLVATMAILGPGVVMRAALWPVAVWLAVMGVI